MKQSPPLRPMSAAVSAAKSPPSAVKVTILSEVRFLRESLADILARDAGIIILGHYPTLSDALPQPSACPADVFLLDAAFTGGICSVSRIRQVIPRVRIIVFAVVETEENIIPWAEAGIAGYVPNTASLRELTGLLHRIINGRQTCSEEVAAGLLRRIAAGPSIESAAAGSNALLTERELQILGLIETGLGNKDIARHLAISLSTTKSHVHNLLEKLNLQRRGQAAAWVRRNAQELAGARTLAHATVNGSRVL